VKLNDKSEAKDPAPPAVSRRELFGLLELLSQLSGKGTPNPFPLVMKGEM
jgi:hypothetical protein